MKNFLIVANWKMQLSYKQTLMYTQEITNALEQEAHAATIVICPSFESLTEVKNIIKGSCLDLGAQDCSTHQKGPYTGQVQAQSLADIGCSYCIIGHHEARQQGQTDYQIARKAHNLLTVGITPILCLGESQKSPDFLGEITKQLDHFLSLSAVSLQHLAIAYEPAWSIGTGLLPSPEHIEQVFGHISNLFVGAGSSFKLAFLYGGSVDSNSIKVLRSIPHLSGLLIGSATLDSQKFKNIVRSCITNYL